MSKSRLVAGGLLAVTFALGALAGGAATMVADRTGHHRGDPYSPPSYASRLAEDLGLAPEQEAKVVEVLERHQPAMDSIWAQVGSQFDAERQTLRRDIRALLTPDQQAKYQTMLARLDSLRRNRGKRHASH